MARPMPREAPVRMVRCFIPVEIGPVNSLVPLIGAVMSQGAVWVVDGDGAGRAVPQLPQTTFTGTPLLAPCPCALASDADQTRAVESALLHAPTAAQVESLAGGVVGGFGGYSGIAMWPSNAGNGHALTGSYIAGTLEQVRALGRFLLAASSPPPTSEVAAMIALVTGRSASAVVTNFYMTEVRRRPQQETGWPWPWKPPGWTCGRTISSPARSPSTQPRRSWNWALARRKSSPTCKASMGCFIRTILAR
jgi:DUF917 family protein